MVLPHTARRKGGTIQIGATVVALWSLSGIMTILLAHPTYALTPAAPAGAQTESLFAPILDTIKQLTAAVTPPSPQPPLLQASVNVPLPSIVPTTVTVVNDIISPVTQPVTNAVSQATNSPLPTLPSSPLSPPTNQSSSTQQSANPPTQSTVTVKSPTLSGDDEKSVAITTIAPLLSGAATFIGSVIPSTINNIVKGVTNPGIDAMPLLISAGMFIAMLTLVTGIAYILNRNKTFTVGDGRFAQLSQRYDLTQLSALTVVILGAGIIVLYLILSRATG